MKLYAFPASPNARKALFVNAHLGLNVPVEMVDLPSGAQREAAYLEMNPNGKVPVLQMEDGATLWESNAIINALCSTAETPLWPQTNQRYDIMRWQFWEACHWTPACGKYISRYLFNNEGVDMQEAAEMFNKYAKVLDDHLDGRNWLSGNAMTTADVAVSAILCYREPCQYPMGEYANINRWMGQIEALDSWQPVNLPG